MSSGSGRSPNSNQPPLDKTLEEALERAKKLAATAPGQKRSNSEELNYTDTKRPNLNGSDMAGMGMGGQIVGVGVGGPDTAVETMEVPDNAVGLVIGRGGENISMIQQQSGARVQMSGESNNGYRRNMNQNGGGGGGGGGGTITTEVLVPGNKCGLVIGKGGETIKSLQESLGVKMLLVQENQTVSMGPKPLRIMGFPDKVENAKRVVEQLLNNDDGFRGMGPQRSIGEVIVPRSSVGIIIGKGGETIKRLAAETGAKIQFKPDDDPNTADRCAIIQGTPEQINRATQMISDLVTRGAQGGMGGGGSSNVFYMHVPANKTGLVIGKGGDTIKQICAESGAHVELSRDPMPNDNEKVFIIKGSPYQMHHAQHIIRIKVGDIQPGTPLPPFQGNMGSVQMGAGNPYGPTQFGGGDQFGGQGGGQSQWGQQNVGGQDASAWAQYYSQQQAGYTAPAQPGFPSQTQSYQQGVGGQPQQHNINANAVAVGQQQMVGGGAASAISAPSINPQTGQPDYSAQWCEYYRSMGMHEQANMIEAQMKQQQPTQGARPQQQPYYST